MVTEYAEPLVGCMTRGPLVGHEIGISYRPLASHLAVARYFCPCRSSSVSSPSLIAVRAWIPCDRRSRKLIRLRCAFGANMAYVQTRVAPPGSITLSLIHIS